MNHDNGSAKFRFAIVSFDIGNIISRRNTAPSYNFFLRQQSFLINKFWDRILPNPKIVFFFYRQKWKQWFRPSMSIEIANGNSGIHPKHGGYNHFACNLLLTCILKRNECRRWSWNFNHSKLTLGLKIISLLFWLLFQLLYYIIFSVTINPQLQYYF